MSTPYSTRQTPRAPFPTPASVARSVLPPSLRPPIQNPYEKFSKVQFDDFIDDITAQLKRALGRDGEETSPLSRAALPYEPVDGRHGESGEDEDLLEDSFADLKARRARVKDKARDPREGPGLNGQGGVSTEPIVVSSESEEELSGEEAEDQDEEQLDDERELLRDLLDEELAEQGSDGEDPGEQDEAAYELGEEHPNGIVAEEAIELLSDDGAEAGGIDEEEQGEDEEQLDESADVAPEYDGAGVFYAEGDAGDFAPDQNESEPPIEIQDPWEAPRMYAEDLYTGGDFREGDLRDLPVSPSQLTPLHRAEYEHAETTPAEFALTPGVLSEEEGQAGEEDDHPVHVSDSLTAAATHVDDFGPSNENQEDEAMNMHADTSAFDDLPLEEPPYTMIIDDDQADEVGSRAESLPSYDDLALVGQIIDTARDNSHGLLAGLPTRTSQFDYSRARTPSPTPPSVTRDVPPHLSSPGGRMSSPGLVSPRHLPRAQERSRSPSLAAPNGHIDWNNPPAFPLISRVSPAPESFVRSRSPGDIITVDDSEKLHLSATPNDQGVPPAQDVYQNIVDGPAASEIVDVSMDDMALDLSAPIPQTDDGGFGTLPSTPLPDAFEPLSDGVLLSQVAASFERDTAPGLDSEEPVAISEVLQDSFLHALLRPISADNFVQPNEGETDVPVVDMSASSEDLTTEFLDRPYTAIEVTQAEYTVSEAPTEAGDLEYDYMTEAAISVYGEEAGPAPRDYVVEEVDSTFTSLAPELSHSDYDLHQGQQTTLDQGSGDLHSHHDDPSDLPEIATELVHTDYAPSMPHELSDNEDVDQLDDDIEDSQQADEHDIEDLENEEAGQNKELDQNHMLRESSIASSRSGDAPIAPSAETEAVVNGPTVPKEGSPLPAVQPSTTRQEAIPDLKITEDADTTHSESPKPEVQTAAPTSSANATMDNDQTLETSTEAKAEQSSLHSDTLGNQDDVNNANEDVKQDASCVTGSILEDDVATQTAHQPVLTASASALPFASVAADTPVMVLPSSDSLPGLVSDPYPSSLSTPSTSHQLALEHQGQMDIALPPALVSGDPDEQDSLIRSPPIGQSPPAGMDVDAEGDIDEEYLSSLSGTREPSEPAPVDNANDESDPFKLMGSDSTVAPGPVEAVTPASAPVEAIKPLAHTDGTVDENSDRHSLDGFPDQLGEPISTDLAQNLTNAAPVNTSTQADGSTLGSYTDPMPTETHSLDDLSPAKRSIAGSSMDRTDSLSSTDSASQNQADRQDSDSDSELSATLVTNALAASGSRAASVESDYSEPATPTLNRNVSWTKGQVTSSMLSPLATGPKIIGGVLHHQHHAPVRPTLTQTYTRQPSQLAIKGEETRAQDKSQARETSHDSSRSQSQTQPASPSVQSLASPTTASSASKRNARSSSQPSRTPRVTRSHCRYHKASIPKLHGGDRIFFLIPGCALANTLVMKEEEMEDLGPSVDADHKRMVSDVETLAFGGDDNYIIRVMRVLMGRVDALKEDDIYYVPQPGEQIHRRARPHGNDPVRSRGSKQNLKSSASWHASGSKPKRTKRKRDELKAEPDDSSSPLSSLESDSEPISPPKRPLKASASMPNAKRKRRDSDATSLTSQSSEGSSKKLPRLVIKGTANPLTSSLVKTMPPNSTSSALSSVSDDVFNPSAADDLSDVDPEQMVTEEPKLLESAKSTGRRGRRLGKDAAAYRPEHEPADDESSDLENSKPKRRRKSTAKSHKRQRKHDSGADGQDEHMAPAHVPSALSQEIPGDDTSLR